jgi:glycosyltransferase involved in cell wall biosynthesis
MSPVIQSPKVNVAMTTFNHQQYIEIALRSVMKQDYVGINKIYVIDDASTDSTPEIVESICREDARIVFIRNRMNLGVSCSINLVTERACDDQDVEYLALFSGDDVWHETKIRRQIEFSRENPQYDLIFTDSYTLNDRGEVSERLAFFDNTNFSRKEWIFKLFLRNSLLGPSVLLRSMVWKTCGPFDVSIRQIQDWQFWIRAVCSGFNIFILEEKLTFYRYLSTSISNNESREKDMRLLSEIPDCLEAFLHLSLGELRTVFGNDIEGSELFARARAKEVGLAILGSLVKSPGHQRFAAQLMRRYFRNNAQNSPLTASDLSSFVGKLDLL